MYICCNAGRGLGGVTYRGRDSINMNGGRGIPATFEAETACWLEGLAGGTQQQPRGKEASSSKTQECLLTCNRSSQKDGRKLDSKEVKQLTVHATFVGSKDCLYCDLEVLDSSTVQRHRSADEYTGLAIAREGYMAESETSRLVHHATNSKDCPCGSETAIVQI